MFDPIEWHNVYVILSFLPLDLVFCLKVAFIGISNWALDPAKMNRGILVQTEVPDLEELIESAK